MAQMSCDLATWTLTRACIPGDCGDPIHIIWVSSLSDSPRPEFFFHCFIIDWEQWEAWNATAAQVSAHEYSNHHTYKLTTYKQNKEYSIVTLNMNDLSDI